MTRRAVVSVLLSCLSLSACTSGGLLSLGNAHRSGAGSAGLHLGNQPLSGSHVGGTHPGAGTGLLPHLSPPSLVGGRGSGAPAPHLTVPTIPALPITLPDLDLHLGAPAAAPHTTSAPHPASPARPSGSSGASASTDRPTARSAPRMSLGRLPSPHWHNPFRGLFGGVGAAQALTVGLASALVTGVTAMVTAVATIGLTVALLPVVLIFALTSAIFAGVFGVAGILFSLFGFVAWLFLRDALVMVAVVCAALLALVLGGAALLIGAVLLGGASWRAARRRRLAVP